MVTDGPPDPAEGDDPQLEFFEGAPLDREAGVRAARIEADAAAMLAAVESRRRELDDERARDRAMLDARRQEVLREAEAEVEEWLDEADEERRRIVAGAADEARAEAARIVETAVETAAVAAGRVRAEADAYAEQRRRRAEDEAADALRHAGATAGAVVARADAEAEHLRATARAVVADAVEEAERLRASAVEQGRIDVARMQTEADHRISAETEVIINAAREHADELVRAAEAHAEEIRREAGDQATARRREAEEDAAAIAARATADANVLKAEAATMFARRAREAEEQVAEASASPPAPAAAASKPYPTSPAAPAVLRAVDVRQLPVEREAFIGSRARHRIPAAPPQGAADPAAPATPEVAHRRRRLPRLFGGR